MGFSPGPGGGGGSIAGSSDVALSTVEDSQVLTYDSDSSKWINENSQGGGVDDNLSQTIATATVTITQDEVIVAGNDSSDEQIVELQHISADGETVTLLDTVVVPANSKASVDPAAFSREFVRGDRFKAVRVAGSGAAPSVTVLAF